MAVPSLAEVPVYTELTYEKYLALPPINQRYDIIDGDLYVSPAPSFDHQWDLSELNDRVKYHVVQKKLGVVVLAPHDVVIRRLPRLRTRQPDLSVYLYETVGGFSRAAVRDAIRRDVPPDLAVEILSDSDRRRAVQAKLADYGAVGIREVWLLDPEARSVAVLGLVDGSYREVARFGDRDELVSELLPGLALKVSELFE